MKTVTVRLTDRAYEKLRDAAYQSRATQNEILATGMELWIDRYVTLPEGKDYEKYENR